MPRTSASALLLLAASALAQSPSKTNPTAPTIQTRTNLVVVDVIVTDRSGKNVRGLKLSDFALTEKGAPQQIRSFDEHVAPEQPPVPPPVPALPPGVYTNYTAAPQTAALNILLLDTLNTALKDQSYLHQQLVEYLRSAPPGNRIAIFGLTTQLILLQGFTSDPGLLRAALDKKSMRSSPLLNDAANSITNEELADTVSSSEASSHGALADAVARVQQFEAQSQSFQSQLRARYTLEAMSILARYLSALPGRKNLIWFSGSFPLNILPNGDLIDPFAVMADLSGEALETSALLSRSQVAVYPVDARGLFNAPMYDASQRGSPQTFSKDLIQFNQQTAEEHATMRLIAEQTGGRAFLNTNGLKEAMNTAITTGANFYTLTYSPTDTHWDNSYRKIGLKLEGRAADMGLTLSYRRGYFAVDPNPPAPAPATQRRALTSSGDALPISSSPATMRAAMMRGAPDPTGIVFKARVLPMTAASAPPDVEVDKETRRNPDDKLAHGPWRRYVVDGVAIPGQILARNPATGSYSSMTEFVIHCYDAQGTLITGSSNVVRIKLAAENAQHLQGTGIPFHGVISVPAKGNYFLRIGIHDLITDHVGALEVPILAVKNLPPPPSSSPPDAAPSPAKP